MTGNWGYGFQVNEQNDHRRRELGVHSRTRSPLFASLQAGRSPSAQLITNVLWLRDFAFASSLITANTPACKWNSSLCTPLSHLWALKTPPLRFEITYRK